MDFKKPLKPEEFKKAAEYYFKNQAAFHKGKAPEQIAAQRTKHWTDGYNHIQEVAKTLRELAASHPDSEKRKQANLALTKLNDACTAFGAASLNHGTVFDIQDEENT